MSANIATDMNDKTQILASTNFEKTQISKHNADNTSAKKPAAPDAPETDISL
jgi:hypothetical protein